MPNIRAPWRSLIVRLVLLYAGLALVALMLAKTTLMQLEFNELMAEVEAGGLTRATEAMAAELGGEWPADAPRSRRMLERLLESFVLRLEHPGGHLGPDRKFILTELSDQPLAAALLDGEGVPLASAPVTGEWHVALDDAALQAAIRAREAGEVPIAEEALSPELVRRYLAPVRRPDGSVPAWLAVELRLPKLWHRLLFGWSFESPMLLLYLLLFGIGTAWLLSRYITRRLRRVANAAVAWSRGDLNATVRDDTNDELGRLTQRLNRMAADLRDHVHARAQLATLSERQRLARDLHDTVKQQAFALNMLLASLERRPGIGEEARAGLGEARMVTAQIQHELVQIIDELRADGSESPLAAAILERCTDWSRRSGLGLKTDVDDRAPEPAPDARLTLLRILDEALANVQRHSGAANARVTLRRKDERMHLTVEDDGRGLPAEVAPGMGLENMRARAGQLPEGRFEIGAGNGRGTRVAVSWRP